uniref:putative lipid-transfer protein DIR1 n=1 Tax=Erigeron canadensis TaxID=72917 RepID=UPI001CB88D86|nr:putative lipid-transfer protein DIR1 [Erigeron canadensis]
MVMAKALVVVFCVFLVVINGLEAVEICNMTEDGLVSCKPSVTNPNPAKPTPECCKAVSGADLKCLCSYKNSVMLPSLGIDPGLAIALPEKCNLPPPPC